MMRSEKGVWYGRFDVDDDEDDGERLPFCLRVAATLLYLSDRRQGLGLGLGYSILGFTCNLEAKDF